MTMSKGVILRGHLPDGYYPHLWWAEEVLAGATGCGRVDDMVVGLGYKFV